MKNFLNIFFLITIIFVSFFSVVNAQVGDVSSLEESIQNFVSNISVNQDNSVDVIETITFNTGMQEHHGIYRDIYPYSSTGQRMTIGNIIVVDEQNIPYIFTVSDMGSDVRIKIGDPNKTFSGQKTYIIKYNATRAVAQFKDFDEIYWNVTGNEWLMPIYQAQASIVLPDGAMMKQSACYYGLKGVTDKCELDNNPSTTSNTYNFNAPSELHIGQGLTVAVGFEKGIVIPYSNNDKVSNFLDIYSNWLFAIILPFLTLIFSLLYWYKKGRDPKGTGVIVPQYDVPDGLTPMEVAGIVNEKVSAKDISAEIIYLATEGYLKINQIENKVLIYFTKTDYELTQLKKSGDLVNDFDRDLLDDLFGLVVLSKVSKLSELKNLFYQNAKKIIESALNSLLVKGYYKNLGRMKDDTKTHSFIGNVFSLIFISACVSFPVGAIFGSFLGMNPFSFMLGTFLSIIIFVIVSRYNPAKTKKGVASKEYLLGLKNYLQIAEKDRLLFHNAPEKKPEVFEKLLPYAMVLGVANIWAKEFEGIYTTPPSWYSGPTGSAFNAIYFTNSLSNFSSFASSSLTSSPSSSSGSGGGGFSGGGGGGGGGGSW